MTETIYMTSPQIDCAGSEQWTASLYAHANSPTDWARYSRTVTTTAGATWIKLQIYADSDGWLGVILSDSVSGVIENAQLVGGSFTQYYVDGIQLERAASLASYCDGDQDNCRWGAVAHSSMSYRGGVYYGDLLPMRRIRIRVPGEASYYYIFSGYVDGWPQTWEDGVTPTVNLRCCDGFKVLGLCDLNTTFVQELSGVRVDNVLQAVGWTLGGSWILDSLYNSQLGTTTILGPVGDRVLSDGDSQVMAQTLENVNALQYLTDVVDSENGMLFMSGNGEVVFRNRYYLYGVASLDTFDDQSTTTPYSDLQLDWDDRYIYNDVRMNRINSTQQTASDTDSQLTYFKRTFQNDRLLLTTDTEVAARCGYMIGRYREPHWRSRGFSLGGGENLWVSMMRMDIGDRITVVRHPQGGTAITIQFRIEGIEHVIGERGQTWQTRWMLSTNDAYSYWMLTTGADEFASRSVLGDTTVLGY